MYEWTDPDTGDVYKINCIVGALPNERDHLEYRMQETAEMTTANYWWKLPPFVNSEDLKKIEEHFHGPLISGIDPRAFDRDDKRLEVGNRVEVVQGELGYDHDMAKPAVIKEIISDTEIKIAWRTHKSLVIHPYDVRKSEADDLPTIFEVFSQIRAICDDLKHDYEDRGTEVVMEAIEVLSKLGDYDEPLINTIRDAQEGDPSANAQINRMIEDH